MGKKKIKTFTVDEEVYDAVLAMFKESETEVSVSYFLDKCLKDLLRYLEIMKAQKETSAEYTVPMAFIIERTVKSAIISTADEYPVPGMFADTESEISGWQNEYEAHTRNMPSQFWGLVKSGKFKLSDDRQSVTNIKSGRRYRLDEYGDILEMVEKEQK